MLLQQVKLCYTLPVRYICLAALALCALLGASWFSWRLLSKRHTLPCPAWLGWMVEMDNPFTRVNRAAVIVDHLQLLPGMKVLDAGCGPGRLTLPLAEAVGAHGRVLALDLQQEMLNRTHRKMKEAELDNVTYLQAGLGEGQLPLNSFDRAVLVTVLGEIPNQQAAMDELFVALKPGGVLSITEIIFDPHFQRRKKTVALASQAGFQEIAFFWKPWAYTLHLKKPIR